MPFGFINVLIHEIEMKNFNENGILGQKMRAEREGGLVMFHCYLVGERRQSWWCVLWSLACSAVHDKGCFLPEFQSKVCPKRPHPGRSLLVSRNPELSWSYPPPRSCLRAWRSWPPPIRSEAPGNVAQGCSLAGSLSSKPHNCVNVYRGLWGEWLWDGKIICSASPQTKELLVRTCFSVFSVLGPISEMGAVI